MLLIAVIFLIGLTSVALGGSINKASEFEAWDGDDDGYWSLSEANFVIFNKGMADILEGNGFRSIDQNFDGVISKEEYAGSKFESYLKNIGSVSDFDIIDSDQDGLIYPLDFERIINKASRKQMKILFGSADENKDGKLSFDEFSNNQAIVDSVCPHPCAKSDL